MVGGPRQSFTVRLGGVVTSTSLYLFKQFEASAETSRAIVVASSGLHSTVFMCLSVCHNAWQSLVDCRVADRVTTDGNNWGLHLR